MAQRWLMSPYQHNLVKQTPVSPTRSWPMQWRIKKNLVQEFNKPSKTQLALTHLKYPPNHQNSIWHQQALKSPRKPPLWHLNQPEALYWSIKAVARARLLCNRSKKWQVLSQRLWLKMASKCPNRLNNSNLTKLVQIHQLGAQRTLEDSSLLEWRRPNRELAK